MQNVFKEPKKAQPPPGWPEGIIYINQLLWSKLVPAELKNSYKPAPGTSASEKFIAQHVNVLGVVPDAKQSRKNVRIRKIDDPKHPCFGAYGLFAAQTLQPKAHVIDYLGVVEFQETYNQRSDYVLRFDDLSIDAEKMGNEGRFCNDYRGIGQKPNVCFLNYMDERTKEIKVGVFVIGKEKIKKGEELVCM
ncbi:hypothetical protein BC936DRAFT_143539 [Jimgerdemannia flammicorona]|uniref:Uncharacterized protein n=2 Tax=Jimgerdemannia flammicorona TaxID=994334 RepID=A0A433DDP3_9FUNG|nr:hypothetical protein BC936DRAFT_143539 [Jimgerdemannia flammicorona]RUS27946.1 hypothetical protein BC938DRAFT_482542 [Jimgerdemannia flammicorona]